MTRAERLTKELAQFIQDFLMRESLFRDEDKTLADAATAMQAAYVKGFEDGFKLQREAMSGGAK